MRRAALCLVLAACGYRFVAPGGDLPEGLTAVHAPVFANKTGEPTAELLFTEAFREQLSRAGKLGGDASLGVVQGSVEAIAGAPLLAPINTGTTAPRLPAYRLNATVKLVLTKDGRTLGEAVVAGSEDYPSGADVLLTEANRSAALRRLADQLMREGYERLASQ